MRLISKGQPKSRTFRGTCTVCRSTFDAEPDELQIEWDQRENGELAHKACPVCTKAKQVGNLVMYPKFAR